MPIMNLQNVIFSNFHFKNFIDFPKGKMPNIKTIELKCLVIDEIPRFEYETLATLSL